MSAKSVVEFIDLGPQFGFERSCPMPGGGLIENPALKLQKENV